MELRTITHRPRPACRPDAESLGAAQCRCRLPCPVASPPLNGCRCVPGPQPVHTARTVRTPIRQQRKRRCMPFRCMPNPPLATGNRTRHVCAEDNLQTRCKQQAPESLPQSNTRKPCRNWENARPQRLQKMPFGAPNAPIDQLCGRV